MVVTSLLARNPYPMQRVDLDLISFLPKYHVRLNLEIVKQNFSFFLLMIWAYTFFFLLSKAHFIFQISCPSHKNYKKLSFRIGNTWFQVNQTKSLQIFMFFFDPLKERQRSVFDFVFISVVKGRTLKKRNNKFLLDVHLLPQFTICAYPKCIVCRFSDWTVCKGKMVWPESRYFYEEYSILSGNYWFLRFAEDIFF